MREDYDQLANEILKEWQLKLKYEKEHIILSEEVRDLWKESENLWKCLSDLSTNNKDLEKRWDIASKEIQ